MTARDYADYTLTDFLEDDSFIQWVISPDSRNSTFWNSFVVQFPEKEKVMSEASAIIRVYRSQSFSGNENKRDEVWNRITSSIHQQTKPVYRSRHFPLYARIAASVTILLASTFILWLAIGTKSHSVKTAFGEVKAVTLPDQSIVMLNGNSELTYNESWSDTEPREVWITGEAYFDVKHINKDTLKIQPGHRFVVHGDEIDIQVLGTSFNVKSRRDKTNIALLSGKIEVSHTDKSALSSGGLVLMPGDYVEYTGNKLVAKKKLIRPHKVVTWTVHEITFIDPSLRDIIESLQDSHGYSVRLEDEKLLDLRIEGEINVSTVQELLSLVSSTLEIKIELSGNQINIKR